MNTRSSKSYSKTVALTLLGLAHASYSPASTDIGVISKVDLFQKIATEALNANSNQGLIQKQFNQINMRIRDIKPGGIAEASLLMGTTMFGIDNIHSIDLQFKMDRLNAQAKPQFSNFSFDRVRSSEFDLQFQVDVDELSANLGSLEIREHNIAEKISKENLGETSQCNPQIKRSRNYNEGIYAQIQSISLRPKNRNRSRIRFNASLRARIQNEKNKNQFEIIRLTNNLESVIKSQYDLKLGRIHLPEIQVEINGKCYPLDSKAIEKMIHDSSEMIKTKIAESVSEQLANDALSNANDILKSFRFEPKYTVGNQYKIENIDFKARPSLPIINHSSPHQSRDNTRVQKNYPLPQKDGSADNTGLQQMLATLDAVQYNIGLHRIENRGTREIGFLLSDEISVNGRSPFVQPPELQLQRSFDALIGGKDQSDLILSLSQSALQEKLNLITQLKTLEKTVLIRGLSIDPQGFQIHRINSDRLAITGKLIANLNKMDGFATWAGSVIEKLFGRTRGVLIVPLQINLGYSFISSSRNSNDPLIRLNLSLHSDLNQTEFGDQGNLDRATSLVRNQVVKQIAEFQNQITNQKIEIQSSEIVKHTGLKPLWIKLSEDGALNIGLKLEKLDHLFAKALK